MKLHQLRDVLAVAEKGSVRAASRYLGLAQSAMTRSIAGLEHELGAPLFERRKRGSVLTPMGALFLRRAKVVTSELRRAREELQQHLGGVQGSVVACLSTVSHMALLPRALPGFRKRYPQVKLHVIEEVIYQSIETRLKEGTADFYVGVAPEEKPSSELVIEKLFDNTRVVMGRIGHPLSHAKSLASLTAAEWVGSGDKGEQELTALFQRYNLKVPTQIAKGDTALSLLVLVAHTDALSLLPIQWVDFAPVRAVLRAIDVEEDIEAPPIVVIRRADMPLTPAADFLCDLLRPAGVAKKRIGAPKKGR
jgi:LysR family transcriptional regulator, regulator of abg operon